MQPGTVLAGKYRLLGVLGRGGMGSVWKAEHLDLRAPVAVKLMDPHIAESPGALGRFHREARAAAALRSPHVVQILDHGVDAEAGTPFIVMELMEGESLKQRLERVTRLAPADTARVLIEIARALSRAHEAGIVHRDLKPDNVFLVRNDDAEITKVLDFGIAKTSQNALGPESAASTGALLGTPFYMSPEQISGSGAVDHRSDLWSLGIIAFECLVGRRPVDANTIGGLAVKICTQRLPVPSEVGPVPAGFDAWFARATARDPDERYTSARELADDLRRVCAGELVQSGALGGVGQPGLALANTVRVGSTESNGALSHTSSPAGPSRAGSRRGLFAALGVLAAGAIAALILSQREHAPIAPPVDTAAPAPPPAAELPSVPPPTERRPEVAAPPASAAAPPAPSVSAPPRKPRTIAPRSRSAPARSRPAPAASARKPPDFGHVLDDRR